MSEENSNFEKIIIENRDVANSLKALAHPLRLEIVRILQPGPMCVSTIEETIGSTQSNISQHLAILRERNIVKTFREKNQIYYYVDKWRIFHFISLARELFTEE